MSIRSRFVNKAAITRLNRLLAAAGYAPAPSDTEAGGAYAMNIIDKLAGSNPDHKREVEAMIKQVLNIE